MYISIKIQRVCISSSTRL